MSGSDNWNTPRKPIEWIVKFNRGKPIALDPCSNAKSCVGALVEWYGHPGPNGLVLPWAVGGGLVYVNPPYSDKSTWLRKCLEEARSKRCHVIALIPADTDTDHWHRYCVPATRRCFLRGRLVHTGVKSEPQPARFPSVLVYWNFRSPVAAAHWFERAFRPHGWVV